jgi:hypothetical protein
VRAASREPVQGGGSRPESARGVCGGSPQYHQVTWLSHKVKTGGMAGGDGIWARREASMPADTWRDRMACVGSMRTAAKVWPCDEEECYMTYLPNLEELIYISSRVYGQPSIRSASHFLAL